MYLTWFCVLTGVLELPWIEFYMFLTISPHRILLACWQIWNLNFSISLNKLERKFWVQSFSLNMSVKLYEMWCIKTSQFVHSYLHVFTFSVHFHNITGICIISQSWYNRIMTHVLWCVSYCKVLASSQPYYICRGGK